MADSSEGNVLRCVVAFTDDAVQRLNRISGVDHSTDIRRIAKLYDQVRRL